MSTELLEKLTKEKIAVENGLREALVELNAYKKIGTPERIREALRAYMAFGSPAEITKAFDIAEASIKKLQGSVKKYEGLGSIPDIEKALQIAETMLNKYKALGTSEDIEEALDRATVVFEEYKVLGTPKEIDEALDKATSMAQVSKKAKNEIMAKRLAKAYKAPYKTAYALVEKLGAKEAEKMLKSLREEDESGYRLGIEWPGNPADDKLMKNYDDEGEVILGDTVGPEGSIDLDKDSTPDEEAREDDLDTEEPGEGTAKSGGELKDDPEDTDDDEDQRKQEALRRRNRKIQESKGKGYTPLSIFEQLISKR